MNNDEYWDRDDEDDNDEYWERRIARWRREDSVEFGIEEDDNDDDWDRDDPAEYWDPYDEDEIGKHFEFEIEEQKQRILEDWLDAKNESYCYGAGLDDALMGRKREEERDDDDDMSNPRVRASIKKSDECRVAGYKRGQELLAGIGAPPSEYELRDMTSCRLDKEKRAMKVVRRRKKRFIRKSPRRRRALNKTARETYAKAFAALSADEAKIVLNLCEQRAARLRAERK